MGAKAAASLTLICCCAGQAAAGGCRPAEVPAGVPGLLGDARAAGAEQGRLQPAAGLAGDRGAEGCPAGNIGAPDRSAGAAADEGAALWADAEVDAYHCSWWMVAWGVLIALLGRQLGGKGCCIELDL